MESQVITTTKKPTGLQLVTTNADGQIIAYNRTSLDLSKETVKMKVSVPELEIVNRVYNGKDMYQGCFWDLRFNGNHIWGKANLRHYIKVPDSDETEDSGTSQEGGLVNVLIKSFFEKEDVRKVRGDLEIDGISYTKQWEVCIGTENSRYGTILISDWGDGEYENSFFNDIKDACSNNGHLVSNRLLREVYDPIAESVIKLYEDCREF